MFPDMSSDGAIMKWLYESRKQKNRVSAVFLSTYYILLTTYFSEWILSSANFKVEMRTGRTPRVAEIADDFPARNGLAWSNSER